MGFTSDTCWFLLIKTLLINKNNEKREAALKNEAGRDEKHAFFPRGGTLGISGWGCAAGTLEPLAYTRASSAEFCYPILELTPQITPNLG